MSDAVDSTVVEPIIVADTFDYGDADDVEEVIGEVHADDAEEIEEVVEEIIPEDTTTDVEYEGKQYKVDKALKEALMRQADYTRKTQEVADEKRALAHQRQLVDQQAQLHSERVQEIAQLQVIDSQLAQLNFTPEQWAQLDQDDPITAQRLFRNQQHLMNSRQNVIGALNQKEAQRQQIQHEQALEAQRATAKQIEEGKATLLRDIKGWGPELAQKLTIFAQADGWSDKEINDITPPQLKSLAKAYAAQQIANKQPVAPVPKPLPPPVPKVGSGGSSTNKKVDNMSMAEYVQARRNQRNKR